MKEITTQCIFTVGIYIIEVASNNTSSMILYMMQFINIWLFVWHHKEYA